MNSLVTVAVALCNNASTIERCLVSVINQTYDNLEIIVVDDGSVDSSLLKISKFKSDPRVKIFSKKNGGLSSARQFAFDIAKGEYIIFIDADDYLLKNGIKSLVNHISVTKADVCLFSVQFEASDGSILNNQGFTEVDTNINISTQVLAKDLFRLRHLLHLSDSWNKLYRMDFLRITGIKFEMPKGYNGTDLLFNHKLILYNPLYVTISDICYIHVIYSNSAVHRRERHLFEGFVFIIDTLISEAIKLNIFDKLRVQFSIILWEFIRIGLFDAYYDKPCSDTIIRIKNESLKKFREYGLEKSIFIIKANGLRLFACLFQLNSYLTSFYIKTRNKRHVV